MKPRVFKGADRWYVVPPKGSYEARFPAFNFQFMEWADAMSFALGLVR
jgi:hypothetical protein